MKSRPRKPKGVSLSTVRRVDRIARDGARAIHRQFVARDRYAMKERMANEI